MNIINTFSLEEIQLAAMFLPQHNRIAHIKAIVHATDMMDEEVQVISMSLINKLAAMSDEDYNDTSFTLSA